MAFKVELSRIASIALCRILTGIDFTLLRPVFIYSIVERVVFFLVVVPDFECFA